MYFGLALFIQVIFITAHVTSAQVSCSIVGTAGDLYIDVYENGALYCKQDLEGDVDPSNIFIQNGACYTAHDADCTSVSCTIENSTLVSGKTHNVDCEYVTTTKQEPPSSTTESRDDVTSTKVTASKITSVSSSTHVKVTTDLTSSPKTESTSQLDTTGSSKSSVTSGAMTSALKQATSPTSMTFPQTPTNGQHSTTHIEVTSIYSSKTFDVTDLTSNIVTKEGVSDLAMTSEHMTNREEYSSVSVVSSSAGNITSSFMTSETSTGNSSVAHDFTATDILTENSTQMTTTSKTLTSTNRTNTFKTTEPTTSKLVTAHSVEYSTNSASSSTASSLFNTTETSTPNNIPASSSFTFHTLSSTNEEISASSAQTSILTSNNAIATASTTASSLYNASEASTNNVPNSSVTMNSFSIINEATDASSTPTSYELSKLPLTSPSITLTGRTETTKQLGTVSVSFPAIEVTSVIPSIVSNNSDETFPTSAPIAQVTNAVTGAGSIFPTGQDVNQTQLEDLLSTVRHMSAYDFQSTTDSNDNEMYSLGFFLGITIASGVVVILIGSISYILYVKGQRRAKIRAISSVLTNPYVDEEERSMQSTFLY